MGAHSTHTICVTILCIFLIEQILHIVSFGLDFFSHTWYVLDLFIVYVSLVCETVLQHTAEDMIALIIAVRLWKVLAFSFDLFLAQHEYDERTEKLQLCATKSSPAEMIHGHYDSPRSTNSSP